MIRKPKIGTKDGKKAINRGLAWVLAVVLILFLLEGCGRKEPPRLPGKNNDQAVIQKVEFPACPV